MASKPVDLTEASWLGSTVLVISAVASAVGLAAVFIHAPLALLGIGAGVGWGLNICLWVIGAKNRRRLAELEAEVSDLKDQIARWGDRGDDWSKAAARVSDAVMTVLGLVPTAPPPPPRRRSAKPAAQAPHAPSAEAEGEPA